MKSLEGKVALVTGAAGGIGRATSVELARAGASVVAVDIAADRAAETVEQVRAEGGTSALVAADVSVAGDVETAVGVAVSRFAGLDCAVNAAAIEIETAPLVDCDEGVFDRLIDANLRSIFLCLKYELRAMLDRGRGGAIVNVASTNSFRPQEQQAVYTATKHGGLGMTKVAAIENARHGIRINALCPGAIDTPMLRESMRTRGRDPDDVIDRLSLVGRLGHPSEIAKAAVWLCSDDSSFVIGHGLAVDGGYLAR